MGGQKWNIAVAVAVVVLGILIFFRIVPWGECTLAQYDLKRDTSFSWVTGKCMVSRLNGERVYLDQMRDSGE